MWDQGQVVALAGERGVGKLRLLREFTRGQKLQSSLVLEAKFDGHFARRTPHLPVVDVLKACFGLEHADSEAIRR